MSREYKVGDKLSYLGDENTSYPMPAPVLTDTIIEIKVLRTGTTVYTVENERGDVITFSEHDVFELPDIEGMVII